MIATAARRGNLMAPRSPRFRSRAWPWLGLAVLGLTLFVRGGSPASVQAAPGDPAACVDFVITDLTLREVRSTSATIVWRTPDCPSTGYVEYGPTAAYGSRQAPGDLGTSVDHEVSLFSLTPDTTYHYRIVATDASGTRTIQSVDRSNLRTVAATSDNPPTVVNININTIDTEATFTFESTEPATAVLRFGLNPGPTWDGQRTYDPDRNGTPDVARFFTITIDPLTRSTRYYYQITLTGTSGQQYTTDALDFTTSGSPFDHIFYTGECADGVRLGQCHPVTNQFCDGGTLVTRCDRCGADCAAGATCRDGGACEPDPALTGNAFQCNQDDCYVNNGFRRPAPAGCWVTWPRCSANIVLKVQRDRVCDQWATCTESQETTDQQTGAKVQICTGLGACSSLGPGGTCNQVLGQGQCSDDPLKFCDTNADCPGASCLLVTGSDQHNLPVTYRTPDLVDRIQNLSGDIVAGLDWGGGSQIIEGQYPWFLASQWGESSQRTDVERGDFEFPSRSLGQRGASTDLDPFDSSSRAVVTVRLEEGLASLQNQNNLNHVLRAQPAQTCSNDSARVCDSVNPCAAPGLCSGIQSNAFVQTNPFQPFPNLDYFVTFRIRTEAQNARTAVRAQFVSNLPAEIYRNLADLTVTDSWQTIQYGPVSGLSGSAVFRLFFTDPTNGEATFLDDFRISPVLEVRPSEYVFPSCRLYPKEDAEACVSIDENGARYRGQSGYCLERDPGNPSICISWWPVDAIRGEENAFGLERSAGFNAGTVYYCLQSRQYITLPERFDDGCFPDPDASAACDATLCANAAGPINDPCTAPGYSIDRTLNSGGWVRGYRCPRPLEICTSRNWGDDACLFGCVRDANASVLQEYTGQQPPVPGSGRADFCALVSRVSDFGRNRAWAGRTQTSSTFLVSPLSSEQFPQPPSLARQYPVSGEAETSRYVVDYPFGRLVAPEGLTDPATWPAIPVRSTCQNPSTDDPLLCPADGVPGTLAGVASPYAWTVPAAPSVARCTQYDRACTAGSAGNGICQLQSSTCQDGRACSANTGCRSGAACEFVAGAPAGTCSNGGASCRLTNVCSNNPAVSCTAAPGTADAACGGAACVRADVQCNGGITCAPMGSTGASQCQGRSGDFASPDGRGLCTNPDGSFSAIFCTDSRDCSASATTSFCHERQEYEGNVQVEKGYCTTPGTTTPDLGRPCVFDTDCSFCQKPQLCAAAEDCYVNTCQPPAGTTGFCVGHSGSSPTSCTSVQDCLTEPQNVCTFNETCSGGGRDGSSCESDRDCLVEACQRAVEDPRGRCVVVNAAPRVEPPSVAIQRLRRLFTEQFGLWYYDPPRGYVSCPGSAACDDIAENDAAPYHLPDNRLVLEVQRLWQVPTTRCPVVGGQYERPAPAVGDPDYCGLPPEALNARWAGGQTAVTIARGQQVSLEFNTRADAEQVPLRTIYIDWTGAADGSGIRTYIFPYQPKSDPLNPHVIRHKYQLPSGAGPFRPRVLVQDNWGWCNTSTASNPCPTDRTGWPELGVAVTVN